MHPETQRGKLETSFRYNNVGADTTRPATRQEVYDLRDDFTKAIRTVTTSQDEVASLVRNVMKILEGQRRS